MKSKLAAILLAAPLTLTACAGQVIGGGGDEPGAGGSGGSGGSSGTGMGEPAVSAVVMTHGQYSAGWINYEKAHHHGWPGEGVLDGPILGDPSDIYIHLSNEGVSCLYSAVDLSCGGHWEMALGLPLALQQVGTYSLKDPGIDALSTMLEADEAFDSQPGDCSGGGGSLVSDGTVEIISIDETSIQFRLTMEKSVWNVDPNGEYTALRCP